MQNTNHKEKYLSLFSGIGGFELGIQNAIHNLRSIQQKNSKGSTKHNDFTNEPYEWQCVGYSEIDPYAIKIYEKHFPQHKNYGDISKINTKELPDFDLLCGGFPCQSFSIAGKRRGFEDTRGTLFYEIARILKDKKPRLLLLENVKGLLSHGNGRTFATIIATLDELGYDLQWQVLNSKHFGVPQNRERVLIVGHLRGTPRPKVFPILGQAETATSDVFADESQWRREGKLREYQGTSPTLNTAGGGGRLPLILQRGRGNNKGGLHEIAPTVSSNSYQNNNHLVSKTIRTGGRSSPHGSKQNWDSYEVNGTIRRLTPVECARLQGFPDDWHKVEGISDSRAYKAYGNAVTTNVIKAVMERLLGNK